MNIKTTLLAIIFLLPSFLCPKTSFLVAPTRAEITLDRPRTQSFIVSNTGDESIRIEIVPVYFPIGSKEMPPLKHISPKKASIDNITPYILVSPKKVSLKPGARRTIRISVRIPPKVKLKKGEYRAHLLFKMLEIAQKMVRKGRKDKLVMSLSFKTQTAVVIYGRVGSGKPKLNVKCSTLKNGKAKLVITNSGKWKFDGWLRIYDTEAKSKKLVQEKIFMIRETMRDYILNWKPSKKSTYMLQFVTLRDDKEMWTSTCSFYR